MSKSERRVINWMRSVSQSGREKIEFWAEAVFETERWRESNINRREHWQTSPKR